MKTWSGYGLYYVKEFTPKRAKAYIDTKLASRPVHRECRSTVAARRGRDACRVDGRRQEARSNGNYGTRRLYETERQHSSSCSKYSSRASRRTKMIAVISSAWTAKGAPMPPLFYAIGGKMTFLSTFLYNPAAPSRWRNTVGNLAELMKPERRG